MGSECFEKISEDVTAGLRHDPELRLDVQAELRSHLEETAQRFAEEGKSAAESAELAIKAFGSPLEIAGQLLEANKRRMKLRALARLCLGTILVPVALVIALFIGYNQLTRLQAVYSFAGEGRSFRLPQLPVISAAERQRQRQTAEALRNMSGSHSERHRLRAFWEAHRHEAGSHVFFAYYTNYLELSDKEYVREMRLGERLEPRNALFNYRLAMYYLDKGMVAKAEKQNPNGPNADQIRDPASLEQGLRELRKGIAKPYCASYHMVMLQKKYAILPQPKLTEDYLRRISLAAAELFPDLNENRTLARKVPGCARLLIAQGRVAEAEPLLQAWKPITRHMVSGSETLIQLLVAQAMAKIMADESAAIYDQLGRPEQARQTRSTLQQLSQLLAKRRQNGTSNRNTDLEKHSAVLARILFPAIGTAPKKEELAPSRYHEQVMAEQATITLLLLLLTLALLGALARSVFWLRNLRQAKAAPLLLLPTGKAAGRIVVQGILLPLALYFLYTRATTLSGREYGIASMWPRFCAELGLLSCVLLFLPGTLTSRMIRKRCETLGVAVPDKRAERKHMIAALAALTVWSVLCLLAPLSLFNVPVTGSAESLFLALLAITGGAAVIVRFRVQVMRPNALYYGTVARSLVPIYAVSVILIAAIAHPYLIHSEIKWLRADRIVFSHTERSEAGFTPLESRAVAQYQREMLQALAKD